MGHSLCNFVSRIKCIANCRDFGRRSHNMTQIFDISQETNAAITPRRNVAGE
jgi:hypothetical protein